MLKQQVRRMLADHALGGLDRRTLPASGSTCATSRTRSPTAACFRTSRAACASAFVRETEMLFGSILRDDHASVLELLRANYTFLNQQLAQYYGIERLRTQLQARRARRRCASRRPARPGQHPAGHLVSDPHRADDSRQVDHEHAARYSAAGTAAQYSGLAGELCGPGRVDRRLGPRATRAASRQPGLRGLPQADGPARSGAGELRRHRQMENHSRRRDRRSIRQASSSTGRKSTARPRFAMPCSSIPKASCERRPNDS